MGGISTNRGATAARFVRPLQPSGGAAIYLATVPHLDDFNRSLGVIDSVDDPILSVTNSEKRGVPSQLFATCGSWLYGEGLDAPNYVLAVPLGSDRFDFLCGGRLDQPPIFGHVSSNREPAIRKKCCAPPSVDQR